MTRNPTNPRPGPVHRSRWNRAWSFSWKRAFLLSWLLGAHGAVSEGGQSNIPVPQFETGSSAQTEDKQASLTTKEGYFQLEWEIPSGQALEEGAQFLVEQSAQPDFEESLKRYEGRDTASFISGLGNGTFYYRVRIIPPDGEPGEWSESLEVVVDHHSLKQAWTLFGIGAVVFVATVIMILTGNKKVFSSPAATGSKG